MLGLREIYEKVGNSSVLYDVGTKNFPNMSERLYRYANPFSI
jgi:hypothetical protein